MTGMSGHSKHTATYINNGLRMERNEKRRYKEQICEEVKPGNEDVKKQSEDKKIRRNEKLQPDSIRQCTKN